MRKRETFFGSLIGALLVGSGSTGVEAQEAEVADVLEEVIVTARRREESLMDTPVSITAFSEADLISRQIEQSHQISEATPNLSYRNISTSSNIGSQVYIRGIGQVFSDPSQQPGVGIYVDGAYIANSAGSLTEMVDIESVEVLRGPQGTLFGRNTIGGALLINTVKPSEEFGGYVDVSAGDFNLAQVRASVNVPFTDRFFGKFSVLLRDKDGYIDTPNIPDAGKFPGNETEAARVALRLLPTDRLTIDWATDFFSHESFGPPFVLTEILEEVPTTNAATYNRVLAPFFGTPLLDDSYALSADSYTNLGSAFDGPNQADIVNSTLTVEWDIGDSLTFKSVSNFRDMDHLESRDSDGTPFLIQHFKAIFESEQFSQELQLSGDALSERLQWVVGAYYFEEDTTHVNPVDFPFFLITSGARVDNSNSALFGQFTYDMTDRASLTFGARYTDESLKSIVDDSIQFVRALFIPPAGYVDFPRPPNPGAIRTIPNGVFTNDETVTEPYVNLAYDFTPGLMGYVSYSEGFKGGGFVQRIIPGQPVTTFGPEFAEVFELGFKWSSPDNRLRLTGALFNTDYEDMQVAVGTNLGTAIQNAGAAEIDGGEIEFAAALGNGWQISLGAGSLDGDYQELGPGVDFAIDNRLPSVMDWQTNASVSYTAQVASGTITARLDYNDVDDYFADARNVAGTLVPSYSIVNGAVTYIHGSDRWEVALMGRNLADDVIIQEIFGNVTSQGVVTPYISPPRELTARLRYRF